MKKEEFWTQCLDGIKPKISEQAFETWFNDVEIVSLEKEEITLQVPNKFHYEWLESKYRHLIDEVITEIGDVPRVVNYSVMISNKQVDEIPKFDNKDTPSTTNYTQNRQLNSRYNFSISCIIKMS